MSEIKNREYKFFADYIFDNSGIYYSEEDYYRLDSRIKALCEHFKLDTPQALYNLYQGKISMEMHNLLIDTATNNETYFFRDNKPFTAVLEVVKNTIAEKGHCKIWSLGCSTGQEPYSILMTLLENGVDLNTISLRASDISDQALAKAKSGTYNMIEIQRGLPALMMVKYFKQEEREWKIREDLRSKINFDKFNIIKDTYPASEFDLILCRNVIIYQTVENKKRIVMNIFDALKIGGFFGMGSGESLIGIKVDSKPAKIAEAHFYEKTAQVGLKSA